MTKIQETLEYILKAILPEAENVTVSGQQEQDMLILEISAPSELIGKIIGKEGKVIKSIRTILNLAHPEVNFVLKIKE
jgi:predicted RNA-binding protein YlqC (UPF0109 family)